MQYSFVKIKKRIIFTIQIKNKELINRKKQNQSINPLFPCAIVYNISLQLLTVRINLDTRQSIWF